MDLHICEAMKLAFIDAWHRASTEVSASAPLSHMPRRFDAWLRALVCGKTWMRRSCFA